MLPRVPVLSSVVDAANEVFSSQGLFSPSISSSYATPGAFSSASSAAQARESEDPFEKVDVDSEVRRLAGQEGSGGQCEDDKASTSTETQPPSSSPCAPAAAEPDPLPPHPDSFAVDALNLADARSPIAILTNYSFIADVDEPSSSTSPPEVPVEPLLADLKLRNFKGAAGPLSPRKRALPRATDVLGESPTHSRGYPSGTTPPVHPTRTPSAASSSSTVAYFPTEDEEMLNARRLIGRRLSLVGEVAPKVLAFRRSSITEPGTGELIPEKVEGLDLAKTRRVVQARRASVSSLVRRSVQLGALRRPGDYTTSPSPSPSPAPPPSPSTPLPHPVPESGFTFEYSPRPPPPAQSMPTELHMQLEAVKAELEVLKREHERVVKGKQVGRHVEVPWRRRVAREQGGGTESMEMGTAVEADGAGGVGDAGGGGQGTEVEAEDVSEREPSSSALLQEVSRLRTAIDARDGDFHRLVEAHERGRQELQQRGHSLEQDLHGASLTQSTSAFTSTPADHESDKAALELQISDLVDQLDQSMRERIEIAELLEEEKHQALSAYLSRIQHLETENERLKSTATASAQPSQPSASSHVDSHMTPPATPGRDRGGGGSGRGRVGSDSKVEEVVVVDGVKEVETQTDDGAVQVPVQAKQVEVETQTEDEHQDQDVHRTSDVQDRISSLISLLSRRKDELASLRETRKRELAVLQSYDETVLWLVGKVEALVGRVEEMKRVRDRDERGESREHRDMWSRGNGGNDKANGKKAVTWAAGTV